MTEKISTQILNFFTFLLILIISTHTFGQNKISSGYESLSKLEKYKSDLKKATHDSARVKLLNNMSEELYVNKPDTVLTISESVINISEKNITNCNSKIRQSECHVFKSALAWALNNKGAIVQSYGDIQQAIELFGKSLHLSEELNDTKGICSSLNNLAFVYKNLGDTKKSLQYYERKKSIAMKAGMKDNLASSFHNMAYIYSDLNQNEKALEYYNTAAKLFEELGDSVSLAFSLNSIGTIYGDIGEYEKAFDYYNKALKIRELRKHKVGIAQSLNTIGGMYVAKKDFDIALKYTLGSHKLSLELGYPDIIRNSAKRLMKIYKGKNNFKLSLEYYELYIKMRDSISNQENKNASTKSQLKYEYAKKAAADSVKNAEGQKVKDAQLQAQNAQIKNEKFQRYALIGGLAIVILGLGFVVNRFRITQKQKKIIEEQKLIVDEAFHKLAEKNKEVMDSIYYARRIQRALITSELYIQKALSNTNT